MRLGEIKNILKKVLGDDKKIHIESEPVFNGQAQSVKNFTELIHAIDILQGQSWNTAEYEGINAIKNKISEIKNPTILEQGDFNQLNSYITQLNLQINLYFGIIETMTEEQDEKIINIKLPENSINSLEELASLNKSLNTALKKFNIDGDAIFKGFDRGTDWYVVMFMGQYSFQSFIACLQIAQEYFKFKKEYYQSKKAELDYKAGLDRENDFSQEKLNKYTEKRLDLLVENKVEEIIKGMNLENGKTKPELNTQLVIATKELIKQLGDGVEFHLSLNPPEYAKEVNGSLEINYASIAAINATKNKPKQITTSKD